MVTRADRISAIGSDDNKNPARLNFEIINSLTKTTAPQVFSTKIVYDGRKNMFAPRKLVFANNQDTFTVRVNACMQFLY